MNQEGRRKWYGVVIFVILWLVLDWAVDILEFYQIISTPPYFMMAVAIIVGVLVFPYLYYLHKKYPELTQKELHKDKKLRMLMYIFPLYFFARAILSAIFQ